MLIMNILCVVGHISAFAQLPLHVSVQSSTQSQSTSKAKPFHKVLFAISLTQSAQCSEGWHSGCTAPWRRLQMQSSIHILITSPQPKGMLTRWHGMRTCAAAAWLRHGMQSPTLPQLLQHHQRMNIPSDASAARLSSQVLEACRQFSQLEQTRENQLAPLDKRVQHMGHSRVQLLDLTTVAASGVAMWTLCWSMSRKQRSTMWCISAVDWSILCDQLPQPEIGEEYQSANCTLVGPAYYTGLYFA
jgi:hypothetical protein